ncbi:hypothetical protein [Gimesia aquarii]|uniref:Uncharacterized protein n=1 Tax=Gimesia aquarii TaxID=2527964 RepID=A0A517W0E4_9PLAN|nr:hypothetical protein [Gimesia aquarii]QDT98725.1 hypothetical protein V144x_42320 [Gimesia aquarii]
MNSNSRREFLADIGRGMLIGSVGSSLALDLGLSPAFADDDSKKLTFGNMEPLVAALQETPLNKLQTMLVKKLNSGTDLQTLISAAALANTRSFGGQDYTGFHTFMALAPAYQMAQQLPTELKPLPVLKVLYRNTSRIQETGHHKNEVLHPVKATTLPKGSAGGPLLQAATRSADYDKAEGIFAAQAQGPIGEAFNHLQFAIQDELNVHRVVLSWRAWAMLDMVGQEHAHSLLRQSVRFCVKAEQGIVNSKRQPSKIRTVLPMLLDQYRLLSKPIGKRKADDAWVESLAQTIYHGSSEQAADAAAAALAEGFDPEAIGEAISLASNALVLHDQGRTKARPDKPIGSVHGDSVGVHASDSANAWRNIARVSNKRNMLASLIVGAYHTATGRYKSKLNAVSYPLDEQIEQITSKNPATLIQEVEAAIRDKDQFRAAAVVHRYGELGHSARPVFDLLLRYATSEDGALHAEKYYSTVNEEFRNTRAAFRWRQLVGLARVTASEYGKPSPGYAEACGLLNVNS